MEEGRSYVFQDPARLPIVIQRSYLVYYIVYSSGTGGRSPWEWTTKVVVIIPISGHVSSLTHHQPMKTIPSSPARTPAGLIRQLEQVSLHNKQIYSFTDSIQFK